jgi:hypothetical protein
MRFRPYPTPTPPLSFELEPLPLGKPNLPELTRFAWLRRRWGPASVLVAPADYFVNELLCLMR